jgi:MoaA/NifB/PqqE/SkfB family radical SAM enzyme
MTLQGGEPLVHPDIVRLVSQTVAAGMSCAIIINGWFLPRYITSLAEAGLCQSIVSIDSATLADYERNRGLEGLERRLAEGSAQARAGGLPVQASVNCQPSVTTNCRIPCAALGSTTSHFPVRVVTPRLHLTGLREIVAGRSRPRRTVGCAGRDRPAEEAVSGAQPAGVASRGCALCTRKRQAVSCIGGYKYFYVDWNLDIWCCEAWNEPLGSVFDLDRIPDQREPCNAEHANARRRSRDRCRPGVRGRRNRSRGGIALPAQRGTVTLGTDRGDAEDAPFGSPTEATAANDARRDDGRRSNDRAKA